MAQEITINHHILPQKLHSPCFPGFSKCLFPWSLMNKSIIKPYLKVSFHVRERALTSLYYLCRKLINITLCPMLKNLQFQFLRKKSPSLQYIYKRWSTVINYICFNKWRLYSDLYFSCLGFSIFNHYARFGRICCWHSAPQGTISREVNSLERQQIFSFCCLKWQKRAQLCWTVIMLIYGWIWEELDNSTHHTIT